MLSSVNVQNLKTGEKKIHVFTYKMVSIRHQKTNKVIREDTGSKYKNIIGIACYRIAQGCGI